MIDGTNDSVITPIPVGGYPCALVWNSMNNKVYCANNYSGDVLVIEDAGDSVIRTIHVGDEPCAFTYNLQQNLV